MDIVYAVILAIGARHNAPATVQPRPTVTQPGSLKDIPQPLPYVLDEQKWGPGR